MRLAENQGIFHFLSFIKSDYHRLITFKIFNSLRKDLL